MGLNVMSLPKIEYFHNCNILEGSHIKQMCSMKIIKFIVTYKTSVVRCFYCCHLFMEFYLYQM